MTEVIDRNDPFEVKVRNREPIGLVVPDFKAFGDKHKVILERVNALVDDGWKLSECRDSYKAVTYLEVWPPETLVSSPKELIL